jgi:hypothetical protein
MKRGHSPERTHNEEQTRNAPEKMSVKKRSKHVVAESRDKQERKEELERRSSEGKTEVDRHDSRSTSRLSGRDDERSRSRPEPSRRPEKSLTDSERKPSRKTLTAPRKKKLMRVDKLVPPKSVEESRQQLDRFARSVKNSAAITGDGPILTIGASHTGDMYDIALAHAIAQDSRVVIWGVTDRTAAKAAEIARYINHPEAVLYTDGPVPDDRNTFNRDLQDLADGQKLGKGQYWIKEGQATTIVTDYVNRDRARYLPDMIAPEVSVGDSEESQDKAMFADLLAHGFDKKKKKYVIVNFRQSGHSGKGNAPALDTGTYGFHQLMKAVTDLGYTPVPMGEYNPFKSDTPTEANLLKYWGWDSTGGLGRRAEARILRLLAENFDVRGAVGMRSGVTDLLKYLGIPTMSIDIHPQRGALAKGWQRPLKRESAFGRDYRTVSLVESRDGEEGVSDGWTGAFGDKDLKAVKDELDALLKDRRPVSDQHPQDTASGERRAATILLDVEQISDLAEQEPPAPVLVNDDFFSFLKARDERRSTSALVDHKQELEDLSTEIDNLIGWLGDSFVKKDRDVNNALDDLDDARNLVRKLLREAQLG